MENSDFDFKRRISGSLLRLRAHSPFFAALALFARIVPDESIATAATDGRDIFVSPKYLQDLTPAETDGLMLHEVLHAALLHLPRRGSREPLLWNFAADIVVNGIVLKETPFSLPTGTLREESLESLSVEEVYEKLLVDAPLFQNLGDLPVPDLLGEESGEGSQRRHVLEAYWRHAREQAAFILASVGQGNVPAGMQREAGALEPSRLPWRAHLWRYLVRTPVDFQGFDRRFVGRGLYLEALEGEAVRVFVAVDTSGSISQGEMGLFLGEVVGILRSYPHLVCDLFYVDAAAHGPFRLAPDGPIPKPVGGGGTDFRPFFRAVEEVDAGATGEPSLCVYLTDGFGTFPDAPPPRPTLWVVAPGGLALERFPFGEATRLLTAPES